MNDAALTYLPKRSQVVLSGDLGQLLTKLQEKETSLKDVPYLKRDILDLLNYGRCRSSGLSSSTNVTYEAAKACHEKLRPFICCYCLQADL